MFEENQRKDRFFSSRSSVCRETGQPETQPIPNTRVDGQWIVWSEWSDCSRTCNGARSRFRLCTPSPQCGGDICKKLEKTDADTVLNVNNTEVQRETEYDKCNQLCKFLSR